MAEFHRRPFHLVDREFQLKYMLLLVAWGVVLSALLAIAAHQAHVHALDSALGDHVPRERIDQAGRQLLWTLGGIAALSVAGLGLLGLVITHRVAGPIYVMGHYLTLLAEGRYPTPRSLRRHDELQAFYAQFLEAIEFMKDRDARHLAQLEDAIGRMRGALPRAPELLPALDALELEAKNRREALGEGFEPVTAARR